MAEGREIPLSKGAVALVDEEDFEELSRHRWHLSPEGYAARSVHGPPRKSVLMHRQILDAELGEESDHRNGNRLDNRRSNLRKCTRQQNQFNSGKKTYNGKASSAYKGVSWYARDGLWCAFIKVEGKSVYLGRFSNEADAAKAYDAAARKHFGEFARLNFPEEVAR